MEPIAVDFTTLNEDELLGRIDAYLNAITRNDLAKARAVRAVVFDECPPSKAADEHGVNMRTLISLANTFRQRFGVYLEQMGRCPAAKKAS